MDHFSQTLSTGEPLNPGSADDQLDDGGQWRNHRADDAGFTTPLSGHSCLSNTQSGIITDRHVEVSGSDFQFSVLRLTLGIFGPQVRRLLTLG